MDIRQQGLEKEEQRILEAYRQNIISIKQLREQIGNIKKNKEDFEKTMQELKELLQQRDTTMETRQAVDYIKKLKEGIGKFNYETKKKMLHLLNTRIKISVNGIIDILIYLPKDISTPILQPTFSGPTGDSLSCVAQPRPMYW